MTFWKRVRFYLIGLSLGICVVLIFFGPKATQCTYFPNSRAMEEAKIYPMTYSNQVLEILKIEGIDTLFIHNEILNKSKIINFGTDEVRATPCRTYRAQYREDAWYDVVFQICQKETVIEELKKLTPVAKPQN